MSTTHAAPQGAVVTLCRRAIPARGQARTDPGWLPGVRAVNCERCRLALASGRSH